MRRAVIIWWVWTARPFIFHPIQTVRDWFTPLRKLRDIDFDNDDLLHLTPEERKALK